MKGLINFFKSYLKDEDGQTAVEYVLLLAVAALVIFKIKDQVGGGLEKVIGKVFNKIEGITEQFEN